MTQSSSDPDAFGANVDTTASEAAPRRRRRTRSSRSGSGEGEGDAPSKASSTDSDAPAEDGAPGGGSRSRSRRKPAGDREAAGDGESAGGREPSGGREASGDREDSGDRESADSGEGDSEDGGRRRRRRRRRRRGTRPEGEEDGALAGEVSEEREAPEPEEDSEGRRQAEDPRSGRQPVEGEGMLFLDRGGIATLRPLDRIGHPTKQDVFVPKHLIQKEKLREGMVVRGRFSRGQKHKFQLAEVLEVDGKPSKAWKNVPGFKALTSIDPDFHYAVGDALDDTSMRIVDLIAPIGRGQRGLLVAPPRSGKTTILRTFARGIEQTFPDVHLFVLLIDERPEEATEWSRSLETGQVFASTADETPKHHIQLAESVWKRCCRLVEMGEEVVLLIDSLTRLARAYNNQLGSGKTMSGGLDSRAMEHPRKLFGSARNTERAGSLTILGTILVDTGSRMDQLVFEEFKGTGNMELVLNRRLADRRIFPAIDVEKSGTRKEEKLVGLKRLQQIHVLRRVMARLHFAEAMEMLITRLDEVKKTDDFLSRFTVDPEA
jgi:transcription termination factor Rho